MAAYFNVLASWKLWNNGKGTWLSEAISRFDIGTSIVTRTLCALPNTMITFSQSKNFKGNVYPCTDTKALYRPYGP